MCAIKSLFVSLFFVEVPRSSLPPFKKRKVFSQVATTYPFSICLKASGHVLQNLARNVRPGSLATRQGTASLADRVAIVRREGYHDSVDFPRFIPWTVFLVAVEYFQEESSCTVRTRIHEL